MIAFACPACRRKLRVQDGLAGKRAKCPACGRAVTVPSSAAAVRTPAARHEKAGTLQPSPPAGDAVPEALTVPPRDPARETRFPADADPAPRTDAAALGSAVPPELYDFLAPSEAPDELGRLGGYRVLKVLGAGGMGVVFLAEDPRLKRQVALKAMLPGLAVSESARQRFLREAQAAAAIEHDHVVPIYQVGEDRGAPFLAMPFLKGEALEDRLRHGPLPPAEVMRVGREAAEGLAAAHQRGLVHRDVKPANLWLEGERGRVKVLDFGLARPVEDRTGLTQQGAILGTPGYMAPEQATGGTVDARCDLFSLGCVLYRMATGKPAFQGSDPISTLMAVVTEDPEPPRARNPAVPQALSDLVMRLLAKKPEGRPPSARAVIEALEALERAPAERIVPEAPGPAEGMRAEGTVPQPRDRKPTRAAKPEIAPRGSPFIGRPWAVGVAVAAAGLLAVGVTLAVVLRLQTRNGTLVITLAEPGVHVLVDGEEKVVLDSPKSGHLELVPGPHRLAVKRGEEELYAEDFTLKSGGEVLINATWKPKSVAEAAPAGATNRAVPTPGEARPVPPPATPSPLDRLRPEDIPAEERFAWQPKELVAVLGEHRQRHWGNTAAEVAYSPDGKLVVSRGHDRAIRLWDPETMQAGAVLTGHGDAVRCMAFSPDGRRLLSGGAHKDGTVRLWDLRTGTQLRQFEGRHGLEVTSLSFSPDGRLAVSTSQDGTARAWDVDTGKALYVNGGHKAWVWAAVFLPDGRHYLSGGSSDLRNMADRPNLLLCDLDKRQAGAPLQLTPGNVSGLALSPDKRHILATVHNTWGEPSSAWEWDLDKSAAPRSRKLSKGLTGQPRFSPDGRRALCLSGGAVWVWDVAFPNTETFGKDVNSAAFSPDGRQVLYGSNDRLMHLWDLPTRQEVRRFEGHHRQVLSVAFSPDGRQAVSCGGDGTVRRWDVATGKELRPVEGPVTLGMGVALSSDGRRALTATWDGGLWLWDLAGSREGRLLVMHPRAAQCVALSPDGRRGLSGSDDGTVRLWDVESGTELRRFEAHGEVLRVAFSPDGKQAFSAGTDGGLRRWDLEGGRERPRLGGQHGKEFFVAVSRDGRRALSWGQDRSVWLWNLEGGAAPHCLGGPIERIYGAAFSPDGRQVAAAGDGHTVYLWSDLDRDPPRGQPFARWYTERVEDVAFAPDGKTLASAGQDGRVILWDAASGAKVREWALPGQVRGVTFAAEGRHLATANGNGTVYVLRLTPPAGASAR